MVRCLLILALVSNQLLSLGQGAMYICMGSDGTFCLETEPHTCTCCEQGQHEEADHDSNACACFCAQTEAGLISEDEECIPSCEITSSAQSPSTEEAVLINENGCGCVHLMIANGQSLPSPRMTYDSGLELNRQAGLAQPFFIPRNSGSTASLRFTSSAEIAFCKTRLDVCSLIMRC
ncbi:MAG: hypothetical protein JKY95_09770 [Planctomycetaceae bacterium]|nr:hypothetical protein [Planctomycetaceae bacterium]